MRLLAAFLSLAFFTFSLPLQAAENSFLPVLNSYVSMKLHLDDRNGQMVGAAWIRVKNTTDRPLVEVPFILNPGLHVTKVTNGAGAALGFSANLSPVSGYAGLRATVGTVSLSAPVPAGSEAEIVIQYRGILSPLESGGILGAKETLNPDFTMIRAESFGYPVIAAPTKASINMAINQPPYYQTATLELPSGYSVAGNLITDSPADAAKIDLKSDTPVAAMVLPIGRFTKEQQGAFLLASLTGNTVNSTDVLATNAPLAAQLTDWLGTPKTPLQISFVPDGYGTFTEPGFIMLPENSGGNTVVAAASADMVKAAIPAAWGIYQGAPGAWDNGLNTVLLILFDGTEAVASAEAAAFKAAQNAVNLNTTLGKMPVGDYQNPADKDAVGTLFFWLLYDRLGHDDFMAFARTLRTELPNSNAGYLMLADVIAEVKAPKAAQKLSVNWLEKGKLDKDIKKAQKFADVSERY
ncbi:hypothetical protein [Kordiimonas pumila]|uniref:Uncharacterized protein n=1 Tax=Kordiimonas pumila TaxID=2161677 RepID=A0ABV7D043_9PROT|nr:hypothetical protein [Kordiimonas pumila]